MFKLNNKTRIFSIYNYGFIKFKYGFKVKSEHIHKIDHLDIKFKYGFIKFKYGFIKFEYGFR